MRAPLFLSMCLEGSIASEEEFWRAVGHLSYLQSGVGTARIPSSSSVNEDVGEMLCHSHLKKLGGSLLLTKTVWLQWPQLPRKSHLFSLNSQGIQYSHPLKMRNLIGKA